MRHGRGAENGDCVARAHNGLVRQAGRWLLVQEEAADPLHLFRGLLLVESVDEEIDVIASLAGLSIRDCREDAATRREDIRPVHAIEDPLCDFVPLRPELIERIDFKLAPVLSPDQREGRGSSRHC